MAVTIMEVAYARLGVEGGPLNGADFESVDLQIVGGCEICRATIAAYNGYPSRSGYWRCADCLGGQGFDDVADFEAWEKQSRAGRD